MNKVVTFDGAPPAGTINLGIGQPSADLLPVELIEHASRAFFADAQPFDFNYGSLAGDARFLSSLAEFVSREYAHVTHPDELIVTGGNSQALDLVSLRLAQPGDTIFVEEPSYFLAFQIFRDHSLNLVGVPCDDDGINLDQLESALTDHQPAFLYTIPSYHNPTGACMSLAKRRRLVELARKHGFVIVADEVYQSLYYGDLPPPALGTMANSGVVVSLGSFSKILAPGMRLGWIQTSAALREKLVATGFINSGGSINHIATHLVRYAIDLGLLDEHVLKLRAAYRSKLDTMHVVLREEFGGLAHWQKPEGGYFFWLRFDQELDLMRLRERARERETGFQPGPVFSTQNGLSDCLRLSFAHYSEDQIAEGVRRLRPLIDA